jgi:hypothetical protein
MLLPRLHLIQRRISETSLSSPRPPNNKNVFPGSCGVMALLISLTRPEGSSRALHSTQYGIYGISRPNHRGTCSSPATRTKAAASPDQTQRSSGLGAMMFGSLRNHTAHRRGLDMAETASNLPSPPRVDASQATACVDWPMADTCQHRYLSARTVETIQSSSNPLRRDWPPRRLNGASELVGSAKSPVIGPAGPPNRPVPGSPGHLSRGFI